MGWGMNKAERLREMERLYTQRAYSDIEMAERLGVDRTTVYRDRMQLEQEYPFVQTADGRYRIDHSRYISSIKVSLDEALALYLAARKASRSLRYSHIHLTSGLEKLAVALRQPMTEKLVRRAQTLLDQQENLEIVANLETITRAWVEKRKIQITYRALNARYAREIIVHPYLIEPSIWSDSIYLIGYSELHKKAAIFKIDRIEKAYMKMEEFTIPQDFDEEELLNAAWGIWFTTEKPYNVKLHFARGRAARRIKESIWHPTQQIEDLPDGSCIWQAQIAEWKEILPWIRGWGADCEVLAPEELRDAVQLEVDRLKRIYFPSETGAAPAYFAMWAKIDRRNGTPHPLIYHLIDSGIVAQLLWEYGIHKELKKQVSNWLSMEEKQTGALLAFLVSLHDLGKATPAFQDNPYLSTTSRQERINAIRKAGLTIPKQQQGSRPRHNVLTAKLLPEFLKKANVSRADSIEISLALGGHHGTFPSFMQMDASAIFSENLGDDTWEAARKEIYLELLELFKPPDTFHLPQNETEKNASLAFLTGLCVMADWFASDEEFFTYYNLWIGTESYLKRALTQAQKIITAQGISGWQPAQPITDFESLFPFKPYPAQQVVSEKVQKITPPALLILEEPTGSGKTEAAFFSAEYFMRKYKLQGIYIAMPTMATSNQMFERFRTFLEQNNPGNLINLQLIHGQSFNMDNFQQMQIRNVMDNDGAKNEGMVRALGWFLPHKRALLAPFGVGTVDQSFLSVLKTRHFFLRLFGLTEKIIIFDEVHAYDTYMTALFERLLSWLHAMGTTVILLSATLPEVTRKKLVAAYTGNNNINLPSASYPRLTIANDETTQAQSLPAQSSQNYQLEWISPSPKEIAAYLRERLAEGGTAAVICNRVQRAQEVYRAIHEANIVAEDQLILFHARFPFNWRQQIEEKVLMKFGKGGDRSKSIVVATQVIEQSLDLDFDLMITDLAPVDLILQRAGRIHRHAKNDGTRPPSLRSARLVITRPGMTDSLPDFGNDTYIYDKYFLLKTWLVLKDLTNLQLPQDTTTLIETVYGGLPLQAKISPKIEAALQVLHDEMEQKHDNEKIEAKKRLITNTESKDFLDLSSSELEEENPEVHKSFQALTRLAEPGISIVCLHQTPEGPALEPDGEGAPLNLEKEPDYSLIRALLARTISIHHRGVLYPLLNKPKHAPWKKSAALRYQIPVVFNNGEFSVPDSPYVLKLDRQEGLIIQKEA